MATLKTTESFNQAVARARAREAAEIAAVVAGVPRKQTMNPIEMIDRLAKIRNQRALVGLS